VDQWAPFVIEMSAFVKRIGPVGSNVNRFACPRCGSTDRERHLRLFLERLRIIDSIRGSAVLHIAPEARLSDYIHSFEPGLYIKGDLLPYNESIRQVDLERTLFTDETFDLVIANHVLEHVADPAAALMEVRRILKRAGRFVCQTPFARFLSRTFEEPILQSPADRLFFYGQEDHLRFFGRDIERIITSAGFVGRLVPNAEVLPEIDTELQGVNENEPFFDFRRAN
jgi:SAM-dependent methyltransferase